MKEEEIDLGNTHIELILDLKTHLSQFFMNFLSFHIGAKSKINYHMEPSSKNKIIIPIYPYELQESHITSLQLIRKKLDELQDALINIDWNKISKQYLWLIHAVKMYGFQPEKSLLCKVVSSSNPILEEYPAPFPVRITMPTNDNIYVQKITANDGSIITTLVDPNVRDYGIFSDLSIPFSEMGIMSNGLHLYEHLAVKGWEGLDEKDCLLINGSTSATGTSYVYSVHKTYESFKTFLDATINFILKSRKRKFWDSDEMKKAIQFETVRTISETRLGRSHTLMSRSDFHAYQNGYNINVFHYWANKPFNILCVISSKEELFLTKKKLNDVTAKYPLEKVKMPKPLTFKNIPVETFITKMAQHYRLEKTSELTNIRHIYNNDINKNTLYGIDCALHIDMEDDAGVSDGNNILSALLIYNKFLKEESLQHYCDTHVLPYSNLDYISGLSSNFSSEYYN